ncbi:MAG: YggN family protein [Colwellia sp.]|nr:YggN family protein [Colwellia sp.]
MTYFLTTLIASSFTAALVSSTVYANESCSVDLSAGFKINKNSIEFLQSGNESKDQTLYRINEGSKLFVGNKKLALTAKQKTLVKQYDGKIRQLVPQVKSVAIEGVDLAIDGVNLAFNGLLGEGNAVGADLTKELNLIRDQVTSNLTIENGISVGVDGLESEELLGKDFEQRIESAVEKAVLNSMGSILMAVGQQMMAGDGDEGSFETRMEDFSNTIEHEMTTRSDQIEAKAQALCLNIAKLDVLEEKLKAEIEPLATTNVFTVTQSSSDEDHYHHHAK